MAGVLLVNCDYCGISINKKPSVLKSFKNVFCSRECASKFRSENESDEFTPFREMVNQSKRRATKKNLGFNITAEHLKNLYDKQGGKCPYTGWDLDLNIGLSPKRISIDRIVPESGYLRGNVQLSSYMANCAKHIFNESDLINFAHAVISVHPLNSAVSGL